LFLKNNLDREAILSRVIFAKPAAIETSAAWPLMDALSLPLDKQEVK
jgi:hypothetical protein